MSWTAGSLVTSTATFVSEATNTPTDPTVITVKYLPPGGGGVQTIVYPNALITRVAAGVYATELDTTGLPGNWTVEVIGTGAVQAIAVSGFVIAQAAL